MRYRVFFTGEVVQDVSSDFTDDIRTRQLASEVVMAELSRVLNMAWQGFHREHTLRIERVEVARQ